MPGTAGIPDELAELVAFQEFEAAFFNGAVWKWKAVPDRQKLPLLMKFLEASDARLAVCRIDAGDADGADLLAKAGFRCIETLLTLACDMSDVGGGRSHGARSGLAPVRPATIGDVAAIERIARESFTHDRFHADPFIADDIAGAIKAAWAGNDVRTRGDIVFVAVDGGEVVGFNACLRRADVAVIDLIAVAPSAQGKGIGRQLVRASLDHYGGAIRIMYVGTQANNPSALAVYGSLGFRSVKSEKTFHWTPPSARRKS